ncbi:hypothetical protein [Aquimarina sediminis]|uniref:hypothetical protein n=1 Tax=Aquimarina sediminis TaxID=2070536 RepID=UPI000FFEDE00|nr:hypothetical protein [Aquimarina sediminis]
MKHYSIIIFLFISIMTSCSSQPKLDLAQVQLPYDFNELKNDELQIEKDKLKFENLIVYTSEDKNLFVFDKITFAKEFSDKYHSPTRLYFYTNESSNSVQFIRLNTHDGINGEKMYQSILKLFGKPIYYSKDKEFFNGVWEKGNTTFLLKQNYTAQIGNEKTVTTDLYILNNEIESLTDYYFSSDFQYYKDFVNERVKKQNSNYTYQQFAEDQKNEFFEEEKYLKQIEKNLPL